MSDKTVDQTYTDKINEIYVLDKLRHGSEEYDALMRMLRRGWMVDFQYNLIGKAISVTVFDEHNKNLHHGFADSISSAEAVANERYERVGA